MHGLEPDIGAAKVGPREGGAFAVSSLYNPSEPQNLSAYKSPVLTTGRRADQVAQEL